MGISCACINKNPLPGKVSNLKKSPEEQEFEELVNKVKWPTKYKRPVSFQYPHLDSINDFITDAQKVINEILKFRLQLAEAIERLIRMSEVHKIKNSNTSHAIIGIVYAIFAQAMGIDIKKLFSFDSKFPFLKVDIELSIPEEMKNLADVIKRYVERLEEATKMIPDLLDKTKDLAEEAITLKDKVKDELKNIMDTDPIVGAKAGKAMKNNVMALKKSYKLAQDTAKMVKDITAELFQAVEVLVEEEVKLILKGKTLSDEGVSKPVDCYKHFNDWEESNQTADEALAYLYDLSKLKEEDEDEPEDQSEGELIDSMNRSQGMKKMKKKK